MRRFAASFMAMTAGWIVMNLGGIPLFALSQGSGIDEVLGAVVLYGFFSSFVIGAAWLLVYLPVYAFVPTRSVFWRPEICVPLGFLVGALVPFGFMGDLDGGVQGAGLFILMASLVGGVAAAVGRWLFPWSRHYEIEREQMSVEAGRRIPWLRT